jgi:uncharacterized protein YecE (DUF72 family)
LTPTWPTTDWTYLRLHEGRAKPRPCYGREALDAWAGRLAEGRREWREAWVYTNNDHRCCAVANAIELAQLVERRGLEPTRVPPRSAVRVVGGE